MPTIRLLSFLGLAVAGLHPAARAEDTPAGMKEMHVLYLGLDVSLTINDTTGPVVDADNQAVQILQGGRRTRVPLRYGGDFTTAVVPRVARSSITIAGLQDEQTFSRGSDPRRDAVAQQMIMATAQSAAEELAGREMRNALDAVDASAAAQAATERIAAANPLYTVTTTGPTTGQQAAAESATSNFSNTFADPAFSSHLGGDGLSGPDAYDALGVRFTLSSPEPRKHVYGVMRVFLFAPDKPRDRVSSIRFFAVPDLKAKPTKMFFLHENLPAGFKLDRYEIHLYSDGEEIATNLSNNRVELTRNEIHQFLILKYVSEQNGGEAPVAIAVEVLDNDLRNHVPAEQMNRAVDVTVDANGRVTALKLEPANWSGPDAHIGAVLREVRFLPAVRKGKPVAESARFVLSEFLP